MLGKPVVPPLTQPYTVALDPWRAARLPSKGPMPESSKPPAPGAAGAAHEAELLAHLARASDRLRDGRLGEAKTAISAALRESPDDVRALNLLGLLHFRSGQLADARTVYLRLLERHVDDTSLRLNLGLVELRRGDFAQAVQHLARVTQAEPDNVRALGYYGLALMRAGQLLKARPVLAKAGQTELLRKLEEELSSRRSGPHSAVRAPASAASSDSTPESPPGGLSLSERPPERLAEKPAPAPTPARDRDSRPGSRPPPPPLPGARARLQEASLSGLPDSLPGSAPEKPPENLPERLPESFEDPTPPYVMTAALGEAATAPPPARPGRVAQPILDADSALDVAPLRSPRAPLPLRTFLSRHTLEPAGPAADEPALSITDDGLLVARVRERLGLRTLGVIASAGAMRFEPLARRHANGAGAGTQAATFGDDATAIFAASGEGTLVLHARGGRFTALALGGDDLGPLTVREGCLFAWEDGLTHACWRLDDGGAAAALPTELVGMVALAGSGQAVLHTRQAISSLRLRPGHTGFVECARLVGWLGTLVPTLVAGREGLSPYVELRGDGVVLFDQPGWQPGWQPGAIDDDTDAGARRAG